VRRADYYNNFTNVDLVNLIKGINNIIPRFYGDKDNPNNGSYVHTFFIGNEGSRVIYLSLVKSSYERKNINFEELERKLKELGRIAKADEMSTVANNDVYFEFRFWWD
jgi:hypothetical protein